MGKLTGLRVVKLQHCSGIKKGADLLPLARLSALSVLDLCGCAHLHGSGMSSLSSLTALRQTLIPQPFCYSRSTYLNECMDMRPQCCCPCWCNL